MGWRFRKRIKIFPGIHINISKRGVSANVGVKGANISFGPDGTYVNTGLPGTGLYRRDRVSGSSDNTQPSTAYDNNDTIEKIESKFENNDSLEKEEFEKNKEQLTVHSIEDNNEVVDDLSSNIDYNTPLNPREPWSNYQFPTLELLNKYDSFENDETLLLELEANKNRVIEVLLSFGIEIASIRATIGPRCTLYKITLAPGVRIKDLRGLEEDVALALLSHHVRFVFSYDEFGTVGIEVPNRKNHTVSLYNIFSSKKFQESCMDLPCAIGRTVNNEIFMFDLAKAPHLLIAGSTGQGKSVAINTLITSLLYKKHPNELKLVLMDPLGLELGIYERIADKFIASLSDDTTVVTNSGQAVRTLNSLCVELDNRYELLRSAHARNIKEYNTLFINHRLRPSDGHQFLPYIVVVIDEYANFILERGEEIEEPIVKLAQLARAVGIHLIISTKRPTNDVITGAIKANMPDRIAFKVPEKVDSQVIIDSSGAEKLLGNGDMLYVSSGTSIRVQCAFIDTFETERICNYISAQTGPLYPMELPTIKEQEDNLNGGGFYDVKSIDPLFEEAARHIVLTQQGSTSMVQRRFSIGYNRAGRLMDQLEQAGIVGTAEGSKPREVLIANEEQLNNLLASLN